MAMKLTIVGCGDAFGSGGRLQSCYHLDLGASRVLVDCGATAMIGLNRLGLAPNDIDTIIISHLHGDHFAGLVWWLLDAQYISRRTSPLRVAGPPGIEARVIAAAEALFPNSTTVTRRFALSFQELHVDQTASVGPLSVTPFLVNHPSGAPSYALRMTGQDRVLAFSGDTEWVEALVPCASGSDLFIAECYGFDRDVPYHMNWRVIEQNLDRLAARRLLLTHMNAEMLANRGRITHRQVLLADDGLVIDV
jgi:ribonuclease BN (tRNA processing enzyme)